MRVPWCCRARARRPCPSNSPRRPSPRRNACHSAAAAAPSPTRTGSPAPIARLLRCWSAATALRGFSFVLPKFQDVETGIAVDDVHEPAAVHVDIVGLRRRLAPRGLLHGTTPLAGPPRLRA